MLLSIKLVMKIKGINRYDTCIVNWFIPLGILLVYTKLTIYSKEIINITPEDVKLEELELPKESSPDSD